MLNRLNVETVLRMRNGTIASNIYDPVTGQFSNLEAKSSLHMVQIDHTELDIMVIDKDTLDFIGRPCEGLDKCCSVLEWHQFLPLSVVSKDVHSIKVGLENIFNKGEYII